MRLSKAELRQVWNADRRRDRRRLLLALLGTLAAFLFCLSWRYNAYAFADKFVPLEYLKSYWLALRLLVSRIFSGELFLYQEQAIDAIGSITYLGALARLRITLMSFAAGAGLSVAGAVFQTAYCNPMASPNILGAGAGVRLGNVLVVMMYSSMAAEHIGLRYQFCYGFTAACVLLVLLLGRLAGQKQENYSVLEMVMMGSVISQALNVVIMYLMYELPEEDLLLLQEIQMGMYIQTDAVSMAIFFGVMAASLLPVLLMRYRLNIIGLNKDETTSIGLSTGPLRIAAQICGVTMVTCAAIHCGEAGMLSMVMPFLIRLAVGADFRKVCVYSALAGGVLLMLCRLLTSFVLVMDAPIPITFIINLALTPVFMVIVAKYRRQEV